MDKMQAENKVQQAVKEIEREQGGYQDAGSDPPPSFGHDSAASPGTSGTLVPGSGGTK